MTALLLWPWRRHRKRAELFSSSKGGSFSSAKGRFFSSVKGVAYHWQGRSSFLIHPESEFLKTFHKEEECSPGHCKESLSIKEDVKHAVKQGDEYDTECFKESQLTIDHDKEVRNQKVSKEECVKKASSDKNECILSHVERHKDVLKKENEYVSERIKEESVFLKKCCKKVPNPKVHIEEGIPGDRKESVDTKVTEPNSKVSETQVDAVVPLHVMMILQRDISFIMVIHRAQGFKEDVSDLRLRLCRDMQPEDQKVINALINASKASMDTSSYWNDVKQETVVSLFLLISKLATVLGGEPGQILNLSKAEIASLGNSL